jgi:hypothetical protein
MAISSGQEVCGHAHVEAESHPTALPSTECVLIKQRRFETRLASFLRAKHPPLAEQPRSRPAASATFPFADVQSRHPGSRLSVVAFPLHQTGVPCPANPPLLPSRAHTYTRVSARPAHPSPFGAAAFALIDSRFLTLQFPQPSRPGALHTRTGDPDAVLTRGKTAVTQIDSRSPTAPAVACTEICHAHRPRHPRCTMWQWQMRAPRRHVFLAHPLPPKP